MEIKADSIQIKEVFNNILNNALDAIPPAGGEIRIITTGDTGSIKITVKDNGPGIDRSIIDKIFDPFFTTKAKGTGLGLSVCQQIVAMHWGTIEIESEPENGTSVVVILPRYEKKNNYHPVTANVNYR